MRRPSVPAAVGVAIVGLLAAACRPDTVRIAFRPRVGAHYRYEIVVRTVTTVRLGGTAPQRTVDEARLDADQTVLTRDADGIRVAVELRRAGSPARGAFHGPRGSPSEGGGRAGGTMDLEVTSTTRLRRG